MSTSEGEPCSTWPLGTFAAVESWVDARTKTGIDSFGRLVDQVMRSEPYRSASRVFWVVDNGSSHRGQTAIRRLRKAYRKAVLVHTPVHASWLNQVEIYFSIIQRKVLTPNDFASLEEVEQRLRLYEN